MFVHVFCYIFYVCFIYVLPFLHHCQMKTSLLTYLTLYLCVCVFFKLYCPLINKLAKK